MNLHYKHIAVIVKLVCILSVGTIFTSCFYTDLYEIANQGIGKDDNEESSTHGSDTYSFSFGDDHVYVGHMGSKQLEYTIDVSGAKSNSYIWSSSNSAISVDQHGLVRAEKSTGIATISVHDSNGVMHDSCIVEIVSTLIKTVGDGKNPGDYIEYEIHDKNGGSLKFITQSAPSNSSIFPFTQHDSPHTIPDAFWIANSEVTYNLWYTVKCWADKNGYMFVQPGSQGSSGFGGTPVALWKYDPVTNISWYDALVWCNAMTEYYNAHNGSQSDLSPVYRYGSQICRDSTRTTELDSITTNPSTYNGFRLPSIIEFEYAARYAGPVGGSGLTGVYDGVYYYSATHTSGCLFPVSNGTETAKYAWYNNNSTGYDNRTHPVGTAGVFILSATTVPKPFSGTGKNFLGLYDMNGNVVEWCIDKSGTNRNLKGGSFTSPGDPYVTTTGNWLQPPTALQIYIGFRIVRTNK